MSYTDEQYASMWSGCDQYFGLPFRREVYSTTLPGYESITPLTDMYVDDRDACVTDSDFLKLVDKWKPLWGEYFCEQFQVSTALSKWDVSDYPIATTVKALRGAGDFTQIRESMGTRGVALDLAIDVLVPPALVTLSRVSVICGAPELIVLDQILFAPYRKFGARISVDGKSLPLVIKESED